MKTINWYINRLRAMSYPEVKWRISQLALQYREHAKFKRSIVCVTQKIYEDTNLRFCNKIHVPKEVYIHDVKCKTHSDIFGLFPVKCTNDKINWYQSFKTDKDWPKQFSYDIKYKQNERYGCIRFNWELNRHYYFAYLAKQYYSVNDEEFFNLFANHFHDWVKENPFLIGVGWTSVMEVAIRSISWMLALSFIIEKKKEHHIIEELEVGILNHLSYVEQHYSRFSSANNHLIVEMVSLGIGGVCFNNNRWINLCLEVLEEELPNQTYKDGVNKEQSVHYHTFVQEAIAILIVLLRRNSIKYPKVLDDILYKMSCFTADLIDIEGQIADIGDSDEGKIMNLTNQEYNHYLYVCQLSSILFDIDFVDMKNVNENVYFLFSKEELERKREKYISNKSKIYLDGGHSILKYKEDRVERILTIDHAELGFGTIAAHGHADALNITLSVNGEKYIVDPGTFIYHDQIEWRDYFRKTINHNTITINSTNQSEMKGAFLWGKRAQSRLVDYNISENEDYIVAAHNGYSPIIHERTVVYKKPDVFIIRDKIRGDYNDFTLTYNIDVNIKMDSTSQYVMLSGSDSKVYLYINNSFNVEEQWQSKVYGEKVKTKAIRSSGKYTEKDIVTIISINKLLSEEEKRIYFNYFMRGSKDEG